MTATIKVAGDTAPLQRIRLLGKDSEPVNLVGAGVQLWIKGRETPISVDVVDAGDGVVRPQRGDLDGGTDVKVYRGKFRVTYAGGAKESFPTAGWFRIEVWADPEGGS